MELSIPVVVSKQELPVVNIKWCLATDTVLSFIVPITRALKQVIIYFSNGFGQLLELGHHFKCCLIYELYIFTCYILPWSQPPNFMQNKILHNSLVIAQKLKTRA